MKWKIGYQKVVGGLDGHDVHLKFLQHDLHICGIDELEDFNFRRNGWKIMNAR